MMKRRSEARMRGRLVWHRFVGSAGLALTMSCAVHAQQTDLVGPSGGGRFGASVAFLQNGNFVVADPGFDEGATDVGAVYLYRRNGELVSRLVGSTANDRVGSGRLVALPSGNAVVCSPDWDNGAIVDAGAATFIDANQGVSGTVSAANSLVADVANSRVCNAPYFEGLLVLANGNYVVASETWAGVGAVTWGSGASGVRGVIGSGNSLTGATAGDFTFSHMVVPLANGNYLVMSASADVERRGALTWGNGASGTTGVISAANSIVGARPNDSLGKREFDGRNTAALTNGNYVVCNREIDGADRTDLGACVWGDGSGPTSAVISPANAQFGGNEVSALSNGHYVVFGGAWDEGIGGYVGAFAWGNGIVRSSGYITPANAMLESTPGDLYASRALALDNGKYVLMSLNWKDGSTEGVGAMTVLDGSGPSVGRVTAMNSRVGSSYGDGVGYFGLAPPHGRFVMAAPNSSLPSLLQFNVGAVTWVDSNRPVLGDIFQTGRAVLGAWRLIR